MEWSYSLCGILFSQCPNVLRSYMLWVLLKDYCTLKDRKYTPMGVLHDGDDLPPFCHGKMIHRLYS